MLWVHVGPLGEWLEKEQIFLGDLFFESHSYFIVQDCLNTGSCFSHEDNKTPTSCPEDSFLQANLCQGAKNACQKCIAVD